MEDWLVQIIVAVVIGAIVGGIARILLPGIQRIGVFFTILAGAIGAYAGSYIGDSLGLSTDGFDWAKVGIEVLLAMLIIGVIGGVGSRRSDRRAADPARSHFSINASSDLRDFSALRLRVDGRPRLGGVEVKRPRRKTSQIPLGTVMSRGTA